MRCFRHNVTEAVGVCEQCGKGLCPECLVDLEYGIACKGVCERAVKAVNDFVARNVRSATGSAGYVAPATYVLFGLCFIVWGSLGGGPFLFLVAGVFLIGAAMAFFNIRRYQKPPQGLGKD